MPDREAEATGLPLGLLRRFRPLRELGRGGCGTVHLVEDLLEPPSPKALKLVVRPRSDPRRRLLRREFDTLRRLRHPGLVSVFDFGEEKAARLLWFTSEYVPGPNLFAASARYGAAELEEVLAALVETLQFLHDRRVLHNDIKPSNVRVPSDPRSARLLDFGLASPLSGGPLGAGTPPYMAPERLRGRSSPSVGADLWSLGVVLYRCAVRRLPFEGEDAPSVLRALGAGFVPPRLLRPDLPRYLDEIVCRLLAPELADRYASAADLLADLERRRGRPAASADSASTPTPLPGPPLLERDRILAAMRRTAAAGGDERGAGCLLLLGEAGMGKSRLLAELRQMLELGGVPVVSAQGAATRTWHLAREIVRRAASLSSAPPLPAVLSALFEPAAGEMVVAEVGEQVVSYLRACAAAAPVVLLVDDLAWADPQSLSAVIDLALGATERSGPAIFAATRDEPGAAALVERWQAAGLPVERLAALSEDAQRAVLSSILPGGGLSESLIGDAVQQAAGNPLALEEIARAWLEAGAVKKVGGVWRAVPGVSTPSGLTPRDLLASRLHALRPDLGELVGVVALAGRPLSPSVLSRLVPELPDRLGELREARLLVETPDGIDVRHPLVREAALEAMPAGEARGLHLRLAEVLEQQGVAVEDSWAHFLRGGDRARGVRYALAAGLRAEAAEDYETGRRILAEALAEAGPNLEGLSTDEAMRLRESLAACLDETGERGDALRLLQSALEIAATADAPRLRVRLGRVLFRSGDGLRAEETLRQAEESAADPLVLIEAVTWRSVVLSMIGQPDKARAICVGRAPLARQLDDENRGAHIIAKFYMVAGLMEAGVVGPDEARPIFDAGVRAAERSGLLGLRAHLRMHRALLLADSGDLAAALSELEEIEKGLRGSSAIRWMEFCTYHAYVLFPRGEGAVALALMKSVLEGSGITSQASHAGCLMAEGLAGLGDPGAIDRASAAARQHREGMPLPGLEIALTAGLQAALWLGHRDGVTDLSSTLRTIDPTRTAASDRSQVDAALAMIALMGDRPEDAVSHLERACAGASRFSRMKLPRWQFHLAWALALAGSRDEAMQAAAAAEAGYERLGNQPEAARARVLASAIAGGRAGRQASQADWLERLAAATKPEALSGEPARVLVDAVAGATGATGAWLLQAGADGPAIVARAGPCAAADPVAWLDQGRAAVAAGEAAARPGVGRVLPFVLGETPSALVVEDRTFPQAFSPEAATVAELALARVLDLIERRQAESELASARRVLEEARTPALARHHTSTMTTVRTGQPNRVHATAQGLDMTLGSVELRHPFADIVGRSRAMRRALGVIDRAVALDTHVLISGETGTGKELLARALHDQGPRAARPFVAINCAAVASTLAESEFFGHVPGAFTGAGRARHRGWFEQATGGTLFLDEVGELDLPVQAMLLRAIDDSQIRPVGGEEAIPVDVRVVAATNRDLRRDVEAGRFRMDLLYRLAVIEVRLPPLRERADDIPALTRHLLRQGEGPPRRIEPEALHALGAYAWPGNVRELANELERAAVFCGDGAISAEHLSPRVREAGLGAAPRPGRAGRPTRLREAMDTLERRMVTEALRAAAGKKAVAARALGVSRPGLALKMRRLGLLERSQGRRPR